MPYRLTIHQLLVILKRLDRCQNHAQTCFVFDSLPLKVKESIDAITLVDE